MKLQLYKKYRLSFRIIIIVLIIVNLFIIYNIINNPRYENKIVQLYSLNKKTTLDYKVHLNQNNLYKNTSLDEGKLYITEFLNYIDTNFNYEFTGEQAAEVTGEYNIIAKVNGFSGEDEKLINIWEKEFPIKEKQYFNSKDGKIKINEKIKLNINDYNVFVKDIKEKSKINCSTALTVFMNVKLTANTEYGAIEETASPSLSFPLDVQMFEITKNNIIDEPGAIEETIQVELPINKNLILIYGIILFLLIIALVILVFFVKIAPDKEPIEKELNKIFKKHGDRLVALNSAQLLTDSVAICSDRCLDNQIYVNSFDDLVRVADELSKPIFYKFSNNYKEINYFFVQSENEKYLYKLENKITEKKIKVNNKSNKINVDSKEIKAEI